MNRERLDKAIYLWHTIKAAETRQSFLFLDEEVCSCPFASATLRWLLWDRWLSSSPLTDDPIRVVGTFLSSASVLPVS